MISGTAPCGVRYAVRRGGNAVAYCALSIGCGTRDEEGFPQGTAHFTEHNIFRGTSRKSASVIGSYLDRLGGELNAYTTKEEIVIHATVLKEDLGKAARLLFELATDSVFPENEIETERGVVLDEIISYKDNPAEDVYDRFEALLFDGHPLGKPILGTSASVKKIGREHLLRFVSERFTPERMALTIVANLPEKDMEKRVLRLLAKQFPGIEKPRESTQRPLSKPSAPQFNKTIDKHHHEANAVIGSYAPSLYEIPERLCAAMLANILGGPASNSLLNRELRERHGWVYGIECSYTQYADTGIMAITFGCDRPNLNSCLKAIDKILRQLREEPLSAGRLKSFRKQLLGQLAISAEAGEAQCLSMGKSLLSWGRIAPREEVIGALEAITAEMLRDMAVRIFAPETVSTLLYL